MWTILITSLSALFLASSTAKDIHRSQKAIFYPRTDGLGTITRGVESLETVQKARANIPATPVVSRIATRKAATGSTIRHNSTPSYAYNSEENEAHVYSNENHSHSELPVSDLRLLKCSSDSFQESVMSPVVGSKCAITSFQGFHALNKGAHVRQVATDDINAPFAIFDSRWTELKGKTELAIPRVSTAVVRRIGNMQPYCAIVPQPNAFSILGNLLASLRLLMLDQKPLQSERPLSLMLMAGASTLPLVVAKLASMPCIMDYLRKRWAFQGECGDLSVEYVLQSMIRILSAESALKLVLRAWFYGRTMQWSNMLPAPAGNVFSRLSQSLSFVPHTVGMLGSSILGGYWNLDVAKSVVHVLVHTAVLTRVAVFTAAQYAFFRDNYHTASFIISPYASQIASVVTGVLCALSSAATVVTLMLFKNLANAVDVEHLLDSAGFRATESQAAATGYARNALHNIPKLFKSVQLDLLVQLTYYHDYLVRLFPRGIEWPVLLLHMTLALNANSAAGLYLALVNLLYSVVNQRLSNYERSILTRDIDAIVQES
ncbi:membrane protein, putative [Babesia bigemina]|uniref:Membrane protein, putative n=1 Tax=Babesia bigemina TaxID=5866 RepID=A0A061D1X5_BABBI|nr:membrane protein, putative [Babesia bigemina]CDR94127.1 membrane protein, putative [Babesia bigemina]|eukprot:XP_012766313.1 membrane protein, putative [Babesia bigemina]